MSPRRSLCLALGWATAITAPGSHPVETPMPSERWQHDIWSASWIMPPDRPARIYGVHHFRKALDLANVPPRFVVHVSADNRYRLFVNGSPVNIGPARGDRRGWRFDTLDLSPWLQAGRNVLAAQVWNFAEHGPVAQVTDQTAFILQGDGETEAAVNTDDSWRVFTNPAYTPISDMRERLWTYIVVGPGDDVDGSRYPWGWEKIDFDDSRWPSAQVIRQGHPRGISTDGRWPLVPRQIPLMESSLLRLQAIRKSEGVEISADFLQGQAPVTIPAHATARILLDQQVLTTAYPELRVSGGRGSVIQLTYAEALYEGTDAPATKSKGHRDVIAGKNLRGFFDRFRPDGGIDRVFRPLRWRTYRYLEVEVQTGAEALTLLDLSGEYCAYPFEERASFVSSDPSLARIWEIAWRTIRTGTHEIFTDSPYYEQLSYVGDTRIEALVSLYVSGDDRMARKLIEAFDSSRNPNGLTSSRWPDSRHQIIPTYSLVWISMVHDYWMLRDDAVFVQDRLAGVKEALRYFQERSDPRTGFYRVEEWWNFVDWIPDWGKDAITGLGGVPPLDDDGHSAIIDLQHVYTLQQAAELLRAFGDGATALVWEERARRIRQHVRQACWDQDRRLLADNARRETFSQHANAYWILTASEQSPELRSLAERLMDDPDVTPATFYFSFYTHRAFARAGLANDYAQWLDPWRGVLDMGLTTIPETPSPDTRSDSHAWGSHPMLGMLTTVGGIRPGSPGFKTVRIEPHLGDLKFVRAAVPHPKGMIKVDLRESADGTLQGTVTLPAGLPGALHWKDRTIDLPSGGRREL